MTILAEAISRYHENLNTRSIAAESAERLESMLRREDLYFGDRPLCGVLRPRFMTHAQYRDVARACYEVGSAFEAVRRAAMSDSALRSRFCLTSWEEQVIHDDPGFRAASPTSRLDAFFAQTHRADHGSVSPHQSVAGLRFTEFNAETPAGGAYNDALANVFLMLPAMHAFSKTHAVFPIPAAPSIVQALLVAYHQWRGVHDRPEVCILDWLDVPTRSEFDLYARQFESLGISVFVGDPRHAEYADGELRVDGKRVTLIYKRVLIDELVTREGLDSPVVRAVRDNAVCMVNPFRCKLLHKKASLAVVSDERTESLLTQEQRAAVAAHVPWTRVVEERYTKHDGRNIDLLPWIVDNRERLVLKPNDEYGGKGIVMGWTVDSEQWQEAVRGALATPHIVQERVEVPSEPWPAMLDNSLHIGERMLDTAPFLIDGLTMQGCLTRIATDPLLNVTSGGGSNVPTFLVEPR